MGRSPAVAELKSVIRKVAGLDSTVLLTGETGTGKGILARVIHQAGYRAGQPFVTVFCPSLERGMVETELFGHRKGAFTGAVSDRIGKVQAAEKGTLFLDEIGELSLDLQPKVLRLLQEKSYERVGDPHEHRADVRVLAATNRSLSQEVRAGRFRRDLHARLNFIPIPVPPLRERRQDIPLLLDHCLAVHGFDRTVLTPEAVDFLVRSEFSWPENVRHLEHLAARLALDESAGPVSAQRVRTLLQAEIAATEEGSGALPTRDDQDLELGLPTLLAQAEREWLEEAFRRHRGLTRAELAAKLKISEASLFRRMRLYGLGG